MIQCSLESKFRDILIDILNRESNRMRNINEIEVTECTSCLRKSYYARKEPLKRINKSIINGKAIHLYIEQLIKKYYQNIEVEEEYEVDFGFEFKILMKPDVILDDRIVEIKTTDRETVNIPSLEHELQANFYAFVLNKDYYEIIYITKVGDIIYFTKPVDVVLFNNLLTRAKILYEYLTHDIPPEREHKYCRACQYYEKCILQLKLNEVI